MAARRLIFVLIVMLMLSSFAAALVPVSNRDDEDPSTATTAPEPAAGHGKLVRARITADARKPKTIQIALGDQLALAVTATRAGEVEIPDLGELEDVEPGTPARFDLLPLASGTYDVRLVEPNRLLGRIVVGPPKEASEKESRKAAGKRAG